jgi:cytidylate kinase
MMLNHSMQALAQHGDVVIAGRGGFAVLAGMPDVLNVRVQAPLGLRIGRAEERTFQGEPARVAEWVQGNDKIQKSFIESVYGVQWDAATAFDLVIDTGKIAPELAAHTIVEAVKALRIPRLRGAKCAAELEVDAVLASTVHEVLHCDMAHVG